jgi:hypothetical protein
MKYKIRVKRKYFDIVEKRSVEIGEELEVSEARKTKLVDMNLVEVVEEVKTVKKKRTVKKKK